MRIVPFLRGSLAAAGAVLLVTACSGDDEPAAQGGGSASATAAPSATTATATATVPAPGTATGSRSPGPPARATSGAPVAVTPLPPAPVGRDATLRTGVTVALAKVADVRVEASGPGEVAGPGVAVTIRVRNAGGEPFDLDGVAVNASYGDGTPANPGGSAQAAPLQGRLAAGKTAEGTYYFTVPAAQRSALKVEVSSSSAANIAVFER